MTPVEIASSRGVTVSGGYCKYGKIVVMSLTFRSTTNASNSPSIVGLRAYPHYLVPVQDTALNCIDITTGITSAITSEVPCGIASNGVIYVQEIKTDHIYNVGGVFLVV